MKQARTFPDGSPRATGRRELKLWRDGWNEGFKDGSKLTRERERRRVRRILLARRPEGAQGSFVDGLLVALNLHRPIKDSKGQL